MDKALQMQINGTLLLQQAEESLSKIIDETAETFGASEYAKRILKVHLLMIKEHSFEVGRMTEFHNQMFKNDQGNTEKTQGNPPEN